MVRMSLVHHQSVRHPDRAHHAWNPKPGFKQVAVPTTPEVPPSPALPITPDVKVRPLDPATELLPPIRPPRTSSLEGKFVGGLDSSHGLAQVTSVDPTSAK